RFVQFLDLIRHYAGKSGTYARVTSTNNVPTAAGFASSSAGFAAFSAAATPALGLSRTDRELSRRTRARCRPASRAGCAGVAEWQKGTKEDGSDSYAVPIAPVDHWDIRMAAVVLSTRKKRVSSRTGMKRTVDTSVFYPSWIDSVASDLAEMKSGIHARDFEKVGHIAEANCLRMHATTLGANPPFIYWQSDTIRVMETV